MDAKQSTSDPDLTPGEVLEMLNMGLYTSPDLTLLTKGEHLERIAAHLVCLRYLSVTGHPVTLSELPPALQRYYRDLAERAFTSTDPDRVSDCINDACEQVGEWINGPGESKQNAPSSDDIAREGIYRALALLSQVRA